MRPSSWIQAATVSASVTGSSSSGSMGSSPSRVEDRDLGVAVGVADAQPQQEAVELRLGQRIGALELDRVLRRDHHERARQLVRLRVDTDLTFLHRLEQRRLRLRRRAVDLVGEHDVREHAARTELEVAARAVPDRDAGDVGRQEVGRELHAPPRATGRSRDRLRERRLADTGHVLDEEVTFGEQAHERQVHGSALAAQHAFDLVGERVEQIFEGLLRAGRGLHRCRPPSGAAWTTANRRPPRETPATAATLPC